MSSFLIYVFIDERKIPFYVGITKNFKRRKCSHLCEVKKGNTLYKYNKLRKVLSQNLTIDDVMIVVENDIPGDKIDLREIEFIAELREQGYKLTNLTDGGDGGDTLSDNPNKKEILKYRKILRQTTDWNKKMSESKKGGSWGKHSEKTKKKLSEMKKGISFSKRHKENLSKARKKRVITAETRRKMSESSKGKINIKKYKLTDPNGNIHITTHGLTKFCEDHGLSGPNLMKVLKAERKHHKKWTIERLKNDN